MAPTQSCFRPPQCRSSSIPNLHLSLQGTHKTMVTASFRKALSRMHTGWAKHTQTAAQSTNARARTPHSNESLCRNRGNPAVLMDTASLRNPRSFPLSLVLWQVAKSPSRLRVFVLSGCPSSSANPSGACLSFFSHNFGEQAEFPLLSVIPGSEGTRISAASGLGNSPLRYEATSTVSAVGGSGRAEAWSSRRHVGGPTRNRRVSRPR